MIRLAQDVGLIYNGSWERISNDIRIETYNAFWDIIANSGIDRRRDKSMVTDTAVKPFSVTASKMLREKGYRKS